MFLLFLKKQLRPILFKICYIYSWFALKVADTLLTFRKPSKTNEKCISDPNYKHLTSKFSNPVP